VAESLICWPTASNHPGVVVAGVSTIIFLYFVIDFALPVLGRVIVAPASKEECNLRYFRRILKKNIFQQSYRGSSLLAKVGAAGFTILELAIVMEIIGFLSVIVMSNYYRSKKAAEVAVVVQNIRNIQIALASYYVTENKYPSTLNTIWLQFYKGKVVEDVDYIGGSTAGNQGGWNFFPSNSLDIRFNGITNDEYAIKSRKSLLPYALYVYGDVATQAKIVH